MSLKQYQANMAQLKHQKIHMFEAASAAPKRKLIESMPSQEPEKAKRVQKKRVGFCPMVRVILIPHVSEYREAGLSHDLWWSKKEMDSILHDAFMERQLGQNVLSQRH